MTAFLSWLWDAFKAWLFLSAWAALVWVLVRANQKRKLPSQPSPYATLDYRGGLKARRLRVVETLERAP